MLLYGQMDSQSVQVGYWTQRIGSVVVKADRLRLRVDVEAAKSQEVTMGNVCGGARTTDR